MGKVKLFLPKPPSKTQKLVNWEFRKGKGEISIKRIISWCVYKDFGSIISQYSETSVFGISDSAMVQAYYLWNIDRRAPKCGFEGLIKCAHNTMK